MSLSSSNSSGPVETSERRSVDAKSTTDSVRKDLTAQAVETFELEVGAGRPGQIEPSDQLATMGGRTRHTDLRPMLRSDRPTRDSMAECIAGVESEAPALSDDELLDQLVVRDHSATQPMVTRAVRRVRRYSAWWIASFGVHAALLATLAFSTLAVMQDVPLEIYASPAPDELVEDLDDLEVEPAEPLDSLDEVLKDEFDQLDTETLTDLDSEALPEVLPDVSTLLTDPAAGESASADVERNLAELGQLFGENGASMSDVGEELAGDTGGDMAKFFGTEIKARRILYMLDNSGGMRTGGKFESLVSELLTSISALQPKQKFYVIFYSDTVYPLFYPQSVRKFMPATDRNLKRLERWLESVELCTGNAIDEALAAAEVIRPDTVFLLTDGNLFTTETKKSLLLNRFGRTYSIHTFGLGVGEKTKTAAGLKQVAEINEGTFRAIEISVSMKAQAKEEPRAYHNKTPGPVWGLKVGTR